MFRKRTIFLTLCLAVPIFLVVILLVLAGRSSFQGPLFEEVKELYASHELQKAQKRMESDLPEVLSHKDGCSLVLSIYAKREAFEAMYKTALRCIDSADLSKELAYEALAFSALKVEKGSEATERLEKEAKDNPGDRVLVALAQLSYEQKDYESARKNFLQLLKTSNMWVTWLARIVTFKPLLQETLFLEELVAELSQKKLVARQSEEKLLMYTKLYKLDSSTKVLEERLKKQHK